MKVPPVQLPVREFMPAPDVTVALGIFTRDAVERIAHTPSGSRFGAATR
jgi:hypothetical protein